MEKIILAPQQMHKNLLLKSRKEDFFVNPKIITKEELLDKYFGRITSEGIYFLFKEKGFNYDNLMQVLPYITRTSEQCEREKNKALYNWKKELTSEGFIEKDEFFNQFISNKEFEIFGYSKNDKELISLLNKYNINYSFKDFSKGNISLSVKKFPLIEDEIFYMLNEISVLLDNGVSPEDIFIYTGNENALFYIRKFYESFGFQINFPNNQSLYSQEYVSAFLTIARTARSFDLASTLLDTPAIFVNSEIEEELKELCSIDLPFDKAFDYVSSVLKHRMIQNVRYENAVNIISQPIMTEGKHIFIPCFAQNIYPSSFKDNEYISDKDKEEINVLTSLEKCRIEDEISKDFVLSNNYFYLSRSSASFSEKYFPSPFVKSLGIKENEILDIPNTIYSKKYGEYRLGIDKDNKLFFLQESKCMNSLQSQLNINYRNYDNSYKNAEAVSPTDFLKLSYTSIDNFYKCPFKYYLDSVLGISPFQENIYTKIGNVQHMIFEHQFEDDFNFEDAFEKALKTQSWECDEKILIEGLKEDIKRASDACILHYRNYAKNPKIKTEYKLQTYLDKNTLLEGRADNIMLLDDTDAIIIDYKTGSATFDKNKLEYGLSLQLPTYAYLFNKTKEFEDYHLAGLYINNVIKGTYKSTKEDGGIIDTNLKLNGITVTNMESALKIDCSISNGKSSFINGITLKDGDFKPSKSLVGEEELKQMEELAYNKYLEANKRIRNNEFEISPLFLGGSNPCKNCEHKDICFVKESQRRGKNDEEEEE